MEIKNRKANFDKVFGIAESHFHNNELNKAIEKYKEHSPDIVTMDITMPEMDGITATKEIKSFDDSANILVCSAMGQQSLVIDAIEAGAKDFIVKPFERQRIKDAMNKIFN
jgi:two-component system chemotaxis response regulator CheY